MFCYQCQETARNLGCTMRGVCGKQDTLCHLFDLLIYALKGLAHVSVKLNEKGVYYPSDALFVMGGLFRTITNANWDEAQIKTVIAEAIELRNARKKELCDILGGACDTCPDAVTFDITPEQYYEFGQKVGVLRT
jgi:hydroxylamine reductase